MIPALLLALAVGAPRDARPAPRAALYHHADSVRVSDFVAYDAARRTVWLTIAAAHDGDNGGMSFNGAHEGARTITVPRGWAVQATFVNEDGNIPHSAVVVAAARPVPMAPVPAAFAGAQTKNAESGLAEGERDAFRFTAATPGEYLIFCGVAGHAQAGMWIRLVVSPTATAPTES